MEIHIAVIIPTYNPDVSKLNRALDALNKQTLSSGNWQLIIVDNNSNNQFHQHIDLSWHPHAVIVNEKTQGLTNARIKGFKEAKAPLIVMVDDDNILEKDYLTEALAFFKQHDHVGAAGGKSKGLFEGYTPEHWQETFLTMVAVRDLGNEIIISTNTLTEYPPCAPIGAGMVLRKSLTANYINYIDSGKSLTSDRKGDSLSSGGDNEINIFILKQGSSVAYNPKLILHHIIPSSRLTTKYLSRLNFESTVSWIKLLEQHQINPWKPISKYTIKIRQIRAYLRMGAWKSNTNFIKWRGACGQFKALATIQQ